jgi:hypothetical protein
MRPAILPRTICPLALALLGLLAGCNRDPAGVGTTYPVAGKVTVAGAPLRSGSVSFRPDSSRGNNTPHEPAGAIGPDGAYRLFTAGKEGAPPGWYYVAVTAVEPADPSGPDPYRPPRSLIAARYGKAETSGLAVEVVADPAPGAYDFRLER